MLLSALAISNAHAVSKSHRKAAEELLTVTGLKASMDRMITQMVKIQLQQKPMMAPYEDIMMSFFSKYLGYENIKHDFIDIYAEEFSEKELRELTVFYKSPIGKKTITKMPVLMNKGAQVGMSKVKLHINELRDMIQAEAKKNAAMNKLPETKK